MAEAHQFCTFYLGDLFFGVEVLKVQEVLRYQEMTEIPLAPEVVSGLINLRGQIVTAIDLRRRLGLPPRDAEKKPMNVIVRDDDRSAVSLLVDEIGDVVQVEDSVFEPPPETVSGTTRELVRGVYKLEGQLLLILDTERAINVGTVGSGA